ncbi:putative Ig domain-containing protein [Hahella aquimaris]|uniref:putative Ig domain-containing protein n=1 Tax=Hahella sp. HNIBRBA332 TaxID=3015983 RepID=UPI00273AE281|nr:putative Ig domain-containing protein [Hahella sp. HNIBRBA332]WLQ16799.1 putative Ig domain-containing protein [Hahella sp. HNIBRBA332]
MTAIRSKSWIVTAGLVLFVAGLLGGVARAEESLCAVVKMELSQELTVERQAFEATMRVTNSLDAFALENIKIAIQFSDDAGNSVIASSDPNHSSAKFFIKLDQHQGINSVLTGANGAITDGKIDPAQVGELRWLIIPTKSSGGADGQGKLYYVGATLNLTYGGKSETLQVAPDTIVVKPQPDILLDYFLTREVNGDNPFTTPIEPAEPYTLGVRISNRGGGAAHKVKIESAQPKIIDNQHQLLVDFKITGSYLDDEPADKTLLIDFGDIPAKSNRVGRWIMESSLTGTFTELTAKMTHADELGGALTSLLQAPVTHLLVHDVKVDLPGRDNITDFLAHEGAGYKVYESESLGVENPVCNDCTDVKTLSGALGGEQSGGGSVRRVLTVGAMEGLAYIKISDPYLGDKALTRVVRGDGKALPANNFWLSKTLQEDKINYDYYLNLFDSLSSSSDTKYTLEFGGAAQVNLPPVIQHISDRTTYETGQVGFLVQSSDPNKTTPTLTVLNPPSGATFNAKGDGTGTFNWFPQRGQAGTYVVNFEATDGALKATKSVKIVVNPENDRDGDGMDDAWEIEHFGDLSRDGTDDYDHDGILDLAEFLNGGDPKNPPTGPQPPELDTPAYDAEVATAAPVLKVKNGAHQDGAYSYRFEVYRDKALKQKVATMAGVAEGGATTEAVIADDKLEPGVTLSDNAEYYWRARLEGAEANSDWVNGRFFLNSANDAPGEFAIAFPGSESVVASVRPTLVVNNSVDVDRDALSYSFYVYAESDASFSSPVAQVTGLNPGIGGKTSWQVSELLEENGVYLWIAKVTDEHGAVATSEAASFIVSTLNEAPAAPRIAAPENGAVTADVVLDLQVHNAVDPERNDLSYFFELDTVETFDSAEKKASGAVTETQQTTSWRVEGLVEDKVYYWRVKAYDGLSFSPWISASFTVDAENLAPPAPTLNNPADGVWVEVARPALSVHPVNDPDGDAVTYRFELYADAELKNRIMERQSAAAIWTPDVDLSDNATYWWRAQAIDAKDMAGPWSAAQSFFVNVDGVNDEPTFAFVLPKENQVLSGGAVAIQWTDADPDSAAKITLLANGVVIADNIEEDLDGDGDKYTWSLDGLADGVYTLSALIKDEANQISVAACCTVTKQSNSAPVIVSLPPSLETEEGSAKTVDIQISLGRKPEAGKSVLINLSLSDASEGLLLTENYLQFTESSWNLPQTVSVRGVDDCEPDGEIAYKLILAPAVSDDPVYSGYDVDDVTLYNLDDEQPGQKLVVCSVEVTDQVVNGGRIQARVWPVVINYGAAVQDVTATASVKAGADLSILDAASVTFPVIYQGLKAQSNQGVLVDAPASANGLVDYSALQWSLTPGKPYTQTDGDDGDNDLQGTDGDDELQGRGGNDLIAGGDGADTIIGGVGADIMLGGKGDDRFLIEGRDIYADLFIGGEGYDRILGGSGDDVVRLSTYGVFAPEYGDEASVEEIDGGAGYNLIEGTQGADRIVLTHTLLKNIARIDGLGGDDLIEGSAGADLIVGGPGADILKGGKGDDSFMITAGDADADAIDGGEGNDQILGTPENDLIRLSSVANIEVVDGRGGQDKIIGTYQNDLLDFRGATLLGITEINAGSGDDVVYGTAGVDVLIGEAGDDRLYGGGGNDRFIVRGASQAGDRFDGGEGFDVLEGGAGDDEFKFALVKSGDPESQLVSIERIDGGGGRNLITGTKGYGTTDYLDLSQIELVGITSIDLYSGDDIVIGSSGADVINGDSGNDTLHGRGGNDHLNGGSANDELYGDEGDDYLNGGVGNDVMYGGPGNDTFVLNGGDEGVDVFIGGEGVDVILGTDGDDMIRIPAPKDGDSKSVLDVEKIDLGKGVNLLIGADGYNGNDALDFSAVELIGVSRIETRNGADVVIGSRAGDYIDGGLREDQLHGGAGADTLIGGRGNDRLYGDEGEDILQGGEDDDYLEGGPDEDVYVFGPNDGSDTINDVNDEGRNRIVIVGGVTAEQVWLRRSGSTLVVEILGYGKRDRIVVEGWYDAAVRPVREIKLDQATLNEEDITALADLMSGYSAPNSGQLTVSDTDWETIKAGINAKWR